MTILFASPNWPEFRSPLSKAFKAEGIDPYSLTSNLEINPLEVEFIIYSPNNLCFDFSKFQNLKAILSLWAGVDEIIQNPTISVPLIRLIDPGIKQGMIEWCTAHLLRHHLSLDNYIKPKKQKWETNIDPPLAKERSVGILGLGTLGSVVAESLQNLNFNVHGWSRIKKKNSKLPTHYGSAGLDTILSLSEILILLLPLTPKTRFLLNKQSFKKCKDGAVILNPGRGELINDNDLLEALNSEKIRHATLDVFCEEPLPSTHPFWKHEGVTITPHIAATTRPNSASLVIAKNIARIRNGQMPEGLVNMKTYY